ncbi:3-hydroxybutyrate dehydrogenase [Brucella haematophila]|uniref:3-hydroxybutyrate dehydrogenase n=1 Tax=Brucella haematophila TaxID=419474 RepID=A0ABX1DPX1_9HYPH|nr:3-hydroxybutyrate dehydrogenase [Brucella haematophila]NKC05001.1 3-hydroxybutyrate dehydrogenase [Brucella haematophila]TMV04471.1 3-hydroxybutyrate dehydrogenase [Brucella haematophila]
MSLKNKVALITGSGSGLGRSIALRYAQEGAKVVVSDLSPDAVARTVEDIKALGGEAFGTIMDVSDEEQVDTAVKDAVAHFGRIDILISNAGIQIVRPVEEFTLAEWKKMLAVHLDGAFLTTRACLRHMYSQKQGSIIYMGSAHAKTASRLKAPYVTAKHGLLGLCRVVAKEGAARGVRANMICPGYVRTPLVDKQIPQQAAELGISEEDVIKMMLSETVDGEFTTEKDIADVAVFLGDFETNALTGQSLLVSHGWMME